MSTHHAEQMRNLLNLVEDHSVHAPMDEAMAPILGQKLKGLKTGLLAAFSQRHKGMHLIQQALVPYMKMFAQTMGRKGQNWDTVTWRTVGNFVTSSASLRLPMGEYTPQRISAAELSNILTAPAYRAIVASYMPSNRKAQLNLYLPKALTGSILDKPVSSQTAAAPASGVTEAEGDRSDVAQKLITGLFVAIIQRLFDKAEEAGEFDTGEEPVSTPASTSPANKPAAPAPAAPAPASPPIDMSQAIETLRQAYARLTPAEQQKLIARIQTTPTAESVVNTDTTMLESVKRVLRDLK